jgi:hypothetical protein
MSQAFIMYVSFFFYEWVGGCFGGKSSAILSALKTEVFNDKVTDKKFIRIWKEVVVLSRYYASICLEGLWKTTKAILFYWCLRRDSKQFLMHVWSVTYAPHL